MVQLTCPMCRTPLQLVTRHAPPALTFEQRMYTWLFDVILDRRASLEHKTRAREIMVKLGIARAARRPTRQQTGAKGTTFGDLVRLVINERAGDQ